MTECTKKKGQKNRKSLIKDFIVLFLSRFWRSDYVPSTASLNLWVPKSDRHKKPKPSTEACTRNRVCAEMQTFPTVQWFLEEFHLQPLTGSFFAATSYHAGGKHKLESPLTLQWASWVSSSHAAQLYLFWERWHRLHKGLAELISLGFMLCLLCHRWSNQFCPHLLYTCVDSRKTVE